MGPRVSQLGICRWATVARLAPLELTSCSLHPGYGTLIRAYVQFLLSKLRFHRHHPDFNGLFEYEEYVTLRGIDDPNEGYVRPFPCAYDSLALHQPSD
jgi:hypothetical protein